MSWNVSPSHATKDCVVQIESWGRWDDHGKDRRVTERSWGKGDGKGRTMQDGGASSLRRNKLTSHDSEHLDPRSSSGLGNSVEDGKQKISGPGSGTHHHQHRQRGSVSSSDSHSRRHEGILGDSVRPRGSVRSGGLRGGAIC